MEPIDKKDHIAFFKLVRDLVKAEELDLAQGVCQRGLVRHPDNANMHCLYGGVLVKLFNTTGKQEYLSEALLSYEKALSLEPDHNLSALMSAKIYYRTSALHKARDKLDMIFANSSGDARAADLLNLIDGNLKNFESDIRQEIAGKKEKHKKSISAEYDKFISHLYMFNEVEGIEVALITDKYGVVLKSINKSKLDTNLFGIAVSNIFRTSRNAAKRSGLGDFSSGVLLSPLGCIYTLPADRAIFSILVKNDTDLNKVEDLIKRYLWKVSS